MAEKKKTEKKEIKKSTVKNNNKSQKAQNKSNGAKTKKASKAQSVLKGREKEVEKIDTYKVKSVIFQVNGEDLYTTNQCYNENK